MSQQVARRPMLDLGLEAILLLENRSAILDAAREISRSFRERDVLAPVIGGIAVHLQGHPRSTSDIDLAVLGSLADAAAVLVSLGFVHDPIRGEFVRDGLPVHLVTAEQLGLALRDPVEIDQVMTVDLADLMAMKLLTGARNMLRAQDLADVIGLIRARGLKGSFAAALPKEVRPAYRKLVKAIEAEGPRRPH